MVAPKHRSRERKPEYLRDIERIFHPKTAEDMTFALSIPLSPVHKEFMNQIAQAVENEAIIEWLIEKFLIKEHKMREKEKEAIIRQMWMKDDDEKEKIRLHYSDMRKIEDERAKLALYTRAQLEQMETKLRTDLKNLGTVVKVHQAALAGLTVKKNHNTQQYRASVTNTFQQNIQAHQIQLRVNRRDPNGNLTQAVLENPMAALNEVMTTMPAPVDLVVQVEKAYIEAGKAFDAAMAQKKTAVEFMPPSPPPPPAKPTSLHFTRQNNVNLEFNLIKKIADSEMPADILAAIKENKESFNKLFNFDLIAKTEQCAVFDEALNIGGDMRNCVSRLEEAREMHRWKAQLLEDVLERKKKIDAEVKPASGNKRTLK